MEHDIKLQKSPELAEVQLKYKSNQSETDYPKITSPAEAERLLRQIWDDGTIQLREEFLVLLLNNAKKCLGYCKISAGSARATIVDPVTIFQVAILANATSIILAHNHPSGNLNASASDKKLTKRIKESGKMLGINVEDHIILTAEKFISLRSDNTIWE